MSEMLRFDNLKQLNDVLKIDRLPHDQVLLVDYKEAMGINQIADIPFLSGFYAITMKDRDCGVKYGRKHYDFSEGSLLFAGPNQVISFEKQEVEANGWLLLFHPDFIRQSELGKKIGEYTFFSYSLFEALHLSDKEKKSINHIIEELKEEINSEHDDYSDEVIISSIELLLNYSKRYYGRQFITRRAVNNDVVIQFESLQNTLLTSNNLEENGLPSVKELASRLGYSSNYLSDLLRKETGHNAQEHIHMKLLDLAKDLLLSTSVSISEISYKLGFGYPGHFSSFFKGKTGESPLAFRKKHM